MRGVIEQFADIVTLLFHEGRNVRHLIKKGEDVPAAFLTLRDGLATNRLEAWRQLQPIRRTAAQHLSAKDVQLVFIGRFRLTIDDLVKLYGHPAWKGSGYGGNAWLPIARMASELIILIDSGQEREAHQLVELILKSFHNTGKVGDKLRSLDELLIMSDSQPPV